MTARDEAGVRAHYGREDAEPAVLAALRAAGRDPDRLRPEDLAPVDQFHTGGRDATLELAALAGIARGDLVLDVGGGIGGPARTLAHTRGCAVVVLDLTPEFCRLGASLTRRTRLHERVAFVAGTALAIPLANASVDVAWTQHSTMNVADKAGLYAELHRVVRPGGRLVMHEIVAGAVQPPHFPVPWANDARISFLETAGSVRALLRAAGFAERAWRDVSPSSLDWLRTMLARADAGPPPPALGLHLLLGPGFGAAIRTLERNLAERRVAVVQGVLERSETPG